MSMAITKWAIFAICNVNQPSPEHRSTTSISDFKPTDVSTPAGSGHRASHQPGSGIPVPSKKPGLVIIFVALAQSNELRPENSNRDTTENSLRRRRRLGCGVISWEADSEP